MLVKVARGADYEKGSLYVVYAIEETVSRINYAVYPVGKLVRPHAEVEPFYVQAGVFDIVDDRVTKDWITQDYQVGDRLKKLKSFPEFFFIEGFWYRFNDRDLEDSDYDIIRAYKKKYENLYADLIK
jgi:hypothetical protein